MPVEEAAAELPFVAGGGEEGLQFGGGVGLADGDGAVVAGEAAGIDEGEGAGEGVVGAGALQVVDEDGEAADAEGFAEACCGSRWWRKRQQLTMSTLLSGSGSAKASPVMSCGAGSSCGQVAGR
jgi:hypothetical protein